MTWITVIENDESYCRWLQSIVNQDTRFSCKSYYTSCDIAFMNIASDNPDVVFLDTDFDIGTPGIQAIRIIKKKLPEARVILLTENDDMALVDEALRYGARGYILKKEGISRILNSVTETAGGEYALSHMVANKFFKHFEFHPEDNPLTDQQTTILSLIAHGVSTEEIAGQLTLGTDDIRYHFKKINEKLDAHSKLEAVFMGRTKGIIW